MTSEPRSSIFRALVEEATEAIVVLDVASESLSAFNDAAVELLGRSREELARSYPPDLSPDLQPDGRSSREASMEYIRRALAGEKPVFEWIHLRGDGTEIPCEIRLTRLPDPEKELVRGALFDIRERLKTQERLRLTQLSVDRAHDSVVWADEDGRILYANDAACRSLGYTREELLTMGVPDFDTGPDVGRWPALLATLRERGHLRFDSTHLRKDGTELPVEISASLLNHSGREYVVGVARDLTERKELETQLRQAQKMEAIGQLTGGIAHDFNNLMSVILLHAEILARAPELESALLQTAVSGIEEAAEKAAGTTRKLLGFSRQATLELRPLDAGEQALEVASMLERVLPENIQLQVRAPGRLPPILSDRTAIQQMLLNLVNNARHAMPDGGTLEISIARVEAGDTFLARHPWLQNGDLVRITVSDSGQGMSEEVLGRAFEPFFTTKPVGEGTGLGLAMVYGLARQQGGTVEAESDPGKGTRVHVFFPALLEEEIDAARSPAPLGDTEGSETILLAEDEEMLRAVGKAVLEQFGYRVIVAEDGEEALDLFLKNRSAIDLIISDVVMPNMGGIELFHAIREAGPPVRFLLASGYPGRQAAAGSEISPDVPFIRKPWRMGELMERVREVLDRPLP